MRTNKIPALIALLCIFVYVGAVLSAAYRVYRSIDGQRQRAGKELDSLEQLVAQSGQAFFSEPFREQVRKNIESCKALEAIIITGSQGNELTFERERGAAIQWNGVSPRFISRFGYTTLRARDVDIPGLRNVNIYSQINTVNYEYMVMVLKQTLLAILGALILSFITMIITATMKTKSAETGAEESSGVSAKRDAEDETETGADGEDGTEEDETEEDGTDDAGMEAGDAGSSFGEFDDFDSAGDSGAGDDDFDIDSEFDSFAGDSGSDDSKDGADEFDEFDDSGGPAFSETKTDGGKKESGDFRLGDFLDEDDLELPDFGDSAASGGDGGFPDISGSGGTDAGNAGAADDADFSGDIPGTDDSGDLAAESSGEKPKGLYSPRSSIGWEAYTRERLDSELHRCASSEQDLAVLLLECGEGINCGGGLYKKLADETVQFFNLRDLSFENGTRGITVIIPNADLQYGIIKAEEFHARIVKAFPDVFHAKSDFVIGLSSRSGRLIQADRLLFEVSKALGKAKTEQDSPIIAFKSDPQKYREFIRKESTG